MVKIGLAANGALKINPRLGKLAVCEFGPQICPCDGSTLLAEVDATYIGNPTGQPVPCDSIDGTINELVAWDPDPSTGCPRWNLAAGNPPVGVLTWLEANYDTTGPFIRFTRQNFIPDTIPLQTSERVVFEQRYTEDDLPLDCIWQGELLPWRETTAGEYTECTDWSGVQVSLGPRTCVLCPSTPFNITSTIIGAVANQGCLECGDLVNLQIPLDGASAAGGCNWAGGVTDAACGADAGFDITGTLQLFDSTVQPGVTMDLLYILRINNILFGNQEVWFQLLDQPRDCNFAGTVLPFAANSFGSRCDFTGASILLGTPPASEADGESDMPTIVST